MHTRFRHINVPGKSVLHTALYLAGLEGAESQLSPGERSCLSGAAAGRQRLLEIGVYEGVSTRLLVAAAAADAEVIGIDPFLRGRLGVCWAKLVARREIAAGLRLNSRVKVRLVEMFSGDAVSTVLGSFDLIFVDGDHSLEGIRTDWVHWSSRVTSGGLIALHDSCYSPRSSPSRGLGSHIYFDTTIRHDRRFAIVAQVDSLSVLKRLSDAKQ